MTNFRRALTAIFIFVGITAGSLRVATAVTPTPQVNIIAALSCLADGWRVDYTAVSSGTTVTVPAWKVELSTPGWAPTINTYQDNTIPYTRTTGVLPLSQLSTPAVEIDVEWTSQATATDTEGVITHNCEFTVPTTVAPSTTASGTVVINITNPATTVSPDTVLGTIVELDPDEQVCTTDELCFETTTTGVFPVTGSDDGGGLIVGGLLLAAGAGAIALSRRRPKTA